MRPHEPSEERRVCLHLSDCSFPSQPPPVFGKHLESHWTWAYLGSTRVQCKPLPCADIAFFCKAPGEALSAHPHPGESLQSADHSSQLVPFSPTTGVLADLQLPATPRLSLPWGCPPGLGAIDGVSLSREGLCPQKPWNVELAFHQPSGPWFPNSKVRGLSSDAESIWSLIRKERLNEAWILLPAMQYSVNELILQQWSSNGNKGDLREISQYWSGSEEGRSPYLKGKRESMSLSLIRHICA